jgi:hypothetical protein
MFISNLGRDVGYPDWRTNELRGLSSRANDPDRRLLAKLVPTFADRGCHVISVTNPYAHNLGFIDLSGYFFFQVVPQLYSRCSVDPVPDPLLLRKSGKRRKSNLRPLNL